MELSREQPLRRYGLLYPMMVIAAIAVIVFSIIGIATISGWMPSALSGSATPRAELARPAAEDKQGPAFQCAECTVIESVRDLERRAGVETVGHAL